MTPEEIAQALVNKWFSQDAYDLFGAETLISVELAAAIRDAYERAAEICDACRCSDPQECEHERLAERIRALKGEG